MGIYIDQQWIWFGYPEILRKIIKNLGLMVDNMLFNKKKNNSGVVGKFSLMDILFLALVGFFWAYSFSTRIGLFFVVPMGLKVLLISTLMVNFALLAAILLVQIKERIGLGKQVAWLLGGSAIFTIIFFLILPYQRVPFRTVHHLRIKAVEGPTELIVVLSPDNNIIGEDAFRIDQGVEAFGKHGFRIPSEGEIVYQNAHTGKLTLHFSPQSGSAIIYWDGDQNLIEPTVMRESDRLRIDGWKIELLDDPPAIAVELPGNTWGQPDLFWAIIGILLPISDFISFSLVVFCLVSLVLMIKYGKASHLLKGKLLIYWLDALVCIAIIVLLIRVGFPEFVPLWFLLLYLPVVVYLFYKQLGHFSEMGQIGRKLFVKIDQIVKLIKEGLSTINRDKRIFYVGIVIIAIFGSITQLKISQPGMIISGDSVHYLEGAVNLARGNGYVLTITTGDPVPIKGFEPGYSMFLAPAIRLGFDPQQVARISNMIFLFISLLLAGLLIYKGTETVFPALIGTTFLAMSWVVISIFSFVMSEPLFIVLLLASFLAWNHHINDPSLIKVVIAGLFLTLMLNVRFAGIAFLPVLAGCILIFQKSKFMLRVRDAFIFGFVALIAPILFQIRNSRVTESTTSMSGRTFNPLLEEYWEIFGGEVSNWFKWHTYFNYDYQRFNAVLVSLGVIFGLFLIWLIVTKKQTDQDYGAPLMITVFLSIILYFGSILVNAIIASVIPTAGGFVRYMIPIFILLVILLSILISFYWRRAYLFPKIIILFFVLVGFVLYYGDYVALMREQPLAYRNYTDRKNECGEDVQKLISSMPNQAFFTNNCEYFYFMTGTQCHQLSFDQSDYEPGGSIYQSIRSGGVVSLSEGFGSSPHGVESLLVQLERFDSVCYLSFYRWPQ